MIYGGGSSHSLPCSHVGPNIQVAGYIPAGLKHLAARRRLSGKARRGQVSPALSGFRAQGERGSGTRPRPRLLGAAEAPAPSRALAQAARARPSPAPSRPRALTEAGLAARAGRSKRREPVPENV